MTAVSAAMREIIRSFVILSIVFYYRFAFMDFKHIKNLTETQAEIRLFDTIGAAGSTGSEIADEIAWLVDHQEVKEILVRINSGGGSMVEGFGIFSALHNAKTKGVTVNVSIEGLAASMAGIIAMVGDHISMIDFGLLMIHDPHLGGAEPNEKQAEILEKFKSSAVTITANRTGISAEEISDLMTAETWLDADEAKAKGFIDEIVTSDIESKKKEEQHMSFMDVAMSLSIKTNPNKMENVKNHFDLDAKASEEDVINKITDIENKAKELESQNKELTEAVANHADEIEAKDKSLVEKDQEISDLGDRIKKSNESIIKTMIKNAVEAGKIKKDSEESFVEMCGSDVSFAEKLLNAIPDAKVNVLKDFIDPTKKPVENELSFRELEKSNPEKLEEIKKNDPEKYKAMYLNEYGVEIKL
jgi:ATP-dependent protease ClpP protease subunit